MGTSRHIQLSVGCAWLAAVYIHAPGVLAVCMPPAPRHCHEANGGTAPAFGRVECVMGMPVAPNDEEGVWKQRNKLRNKVFGPLSQLWRNSA